MWREKNNIITFSEKSTSWGSAQLYLICFSILFGIACSMLTCRGFAWDQICFEDFLFITAMLLTCVSSSPWRSTKCGCLSYVGENCTHGRRYPADTCTQHGTWGSSVNQALKLIPFFLLYFKEDFTTVCGSLAVGKEILVERKDNEDNSIVCGNICTKHCSSSAVIFFFFAFLCKWSKVRMGIGLWQACH